MVKIKPYRVYRCFLAFLILTFLPNFSFGADSIQALSPRVYTPHERLTYKVKYGILRVGTLRLENLGLEEFAGEQLYHLRIFVDSNPKVPFVKIHDVYDSYTTNKSVPYYFVAREKEGNHILKTEYTFDHTRKLILVKVAKVFKDSTQIVTEDTVESSIIYRDVLTLLFYARQLSPSPLKDYKIPTFVLTGRDSCYFWKSGHIRQIELKNEKVPAYYMSGKIKFIGIAGIKDKFEGWFSIDTAHVPLKAKMKAFFGSIKLELEKYENWRGHPIFYPDLMKKFNHTKK